MYVAENQSRMCVPVSVAGLCTDGCIVVYCEKLLVCCSIEVLFYSN